MKYLVEATHAINGEKVLLAIFDDTHIALEYVYNLREQLDEIGSMIYARLVNSIGTTMWMLMACHTIISTRFIGQIQ